MDLDRLLNQTPLGTIFNEEEKAAARNSGEPLKYLFELVQRQSDQNGRFCQLKNS
jgi:hypothetical protein